MQIRGPNKFVKEVADLNVATVAQVVRAYFEGGYDDAAGKGRKTNKIKSVNPFLPAVQAMFPTEANFVSYC